jgi:hypothetical protein
MLRAARLLTQNSEARYLHLLGDLFRATLAAHALDQQARHVQRMCCNLDRVGW